MKTVDDERRIPLSDHASLLAVAQDFIPEFIHSQDCPGLLGGTHHFICFDSGQWQWKLNWNVVSQSMSKKKMLSRCEGVMQRNLFLQVLTLVSLWRRNVKLCVFIVVWINVEYCLQCHGKERLIRKKIHPSRLIIFHSHAIFTLRFKLNIL